MSSSSGGRRSPRRVSMRCPVRTRRRLLLAAAALVLFDGGLGRAFTSEVEELRPGVEQTLARFKEADPEIAYWLNSAVGYAVFRRVGRFGLIIGAAGGSGLVYEGGAVVGLARISELTVGAQFGMKVYSQLVLFQNQAALERFKRGGFEMSAQTSEIIVGAGGMTRDASDKEGILTFTMQVTGFMPEASVRGQSFTFTPLSALVAIAPAPLPPPPPPPPMTQRRGG
jgi:lipid-binding SYLF domain-containing protein